MGHVGGCEKVMLEWAWEALRFPLQVDRVASNTSNLPCEELAQEMVEIVVLAVEGNYMWARETHEKWIPHLCIYVHHVPLCGVTCYPKQACW